VGVCRKLNLICGTVRGMSDSLFRQSRTLILTQPEEVEAYISDELGFDSVVLVEALERAGSEAAMTTQHNAASAFGYRFWDGMVASVRDRLVPLGWRVERPGGLEVVRRSDNRLQITGSLGDDAVGIESADPNCRHQKGQSSDEAMRTNQLTLDGLAGDDPAWRPMLTWWVLYRFAGFDDRRIISELSLPREGSSGRVAEWEVRLFLPEFQIGGSGGIDLALPEPPAPIDIPVRRVGT